MNGIKIKKHVPYPVEKMGENFPLYTICETLRQAWQSLDELGMDKDNKSVIKIRLCIREAMTMAKAMDKKLRSYNGGYSLEFFDLREK